MVGQIDIIGQKIFDMLIGAGYWIVLISGVIATLKHATKHDYEGAIKSAVCAGLSFGGLLLIPVILNMIKEAFK